MAERAWDPDVFRRRRARVQEALGEDAVLVLPAAPEVVVGRDLELRYAVDPDLWYLTGYPEPEAVAVLRGGDDPRFTLFVRDRDPDRELWTGPRIGVEEAGERYGADAVHPVARLEERLPGLLKAANRLFFRLGTGRDGVERIVLAALRRGRAGRQRSGRGLATLADPGLLLDDLRLVKEPAEIDAIRDAVRVTIDGVREGLRAAAPGTGEWVVEAAVEAAFRRAGARGAAFATIAASGPNATILHYIDNRRVMEDRDLLLLDAGAHLHGYNGDLTRTVPVAGPLQGAAADAHALVHEAERAAIAAVRPGATPDDVHAAAVRVLVRGMVDLGLLHGDPVELAADEAAWKPWYPHQTSHWLGLDVHDVGTYAVDGGPRPLEPGMVLTVEPGLYVPASDSRAPAAFRGIGIRIEDDVLVTPEGHEVLSADLPVDPARLLDR